MELVGNVQLVMGNASSLDGIVSLLKKEGIDPVGNPDVYVREYSAFGVDEARELSQRASSRALTSARRIFIVVTPSMTIEAQNALLKTLEEPAGDALFFIVVPSPQQLLPTLRSRAQMLVIEGKASVISVVDSHAFLQAAPAKRLDMLKPLFEKNDDDTRDLSGSIAFLSELESELSAHAEKYHDALESIYRARKYLGDKGSLMKALLEQVALLI